MPVIVKCQQCGIPFLAKPARVADGRGKFCSRPCALIGRADNSVPAIDRFWAKVSKHSGHRAAHMESECWLWTASTSQGGYGKLWPVSWRRGGKCVDAHTFSWELHVGPIPPGLWVLHRCDVPRCVRPDHLWLGTVQDNNIDMYRKRRQPRQTKTHCDHGHVLSDDNVFWIRGKTGVGRKCKTCHHAATKNYYDKQHQPHPG